MIGKLRENDEWSKMNKRKSRRRKKTRKRSKKPHKSKQPNKRKYKTKRRTRKKTGGWWAKSPQEEPDNVKMKLIRMIDEFLQENAATSIPNLAWKNTNLTR